uniref:hypothetical protein n=1 Tax=Arthrobacter sp. 68b TaxID=311808 RepID=UPI001567B572|nr:hypothetical protein [Arthrobacter sp. 68b]
MRIARLQVRGRSAASGWLSVVVAGGEPPFPQGRAQITWAWRQAKGSGGPRRIRARKRACSQHSPWFPLRSNQLMGVRWRGRLLGAAGPSQSSCPSSPFVYVFDVFWLLSDGF